jgi:hypothetical protein
MPKKRRGKTGRTKRRKATVAEVPSKRAGAIKGGRAITSAPLIEPADPSGNTIYVATGRGEVDKPPAHAPRSRVCPERVLEPMLGPVVSSRTVPRPSRRT